MRNYLYIWHEPEKQLIVASGIEFKDFQPIFCRRGGIVLIEHKSKLAEHDLESGFDFVTNAGLSALMNENIYSWGNFVWIDYKVPTFPKLTDIEVSEILFFAHKAKPFKSVNIHSLDNQFMAYVHDDGWYLQLYYTSWLEIETLINTIIPSHIGKLNTAELKKGNHGYWLQNGHVITEEKTYAIDLILNRRLSL